MDLEKLDYLVRVLVWPFVAVVALWLLHPAISDVIRQGAVHLKIDGFDVSTQSAANQWNRQILDLQNKVATLEKRMASVRNSFTPGGVASPAAPFFGAESPISTHAGTAEAGKAIEKILWVDDQPQNNAYEIYALNKDEIQVRTAKSTSGALEILKEDNFQPEALITDLGRTEGGHHKPEAGLTLIKEARKAGFSGPIFVYTTSKQTTEYRSKVKASGGAGTTSSPTTLLEMIKSYRVRGG